MKRIHYSIRLGVALLALASVGPLFAADVERDLATQINAANSLLRSGDVDGAIAAYQQTQELGPPVAALTYNRAVAQYRKGDVAAAAQEFKSAAAADDDAVAASARFNLGNCDYVAALQQTEREPAAAIKQFEAAIRNYRSALQLDASDADARANIELASQMIDKLRKQQEQQQLEQPQQKQPQEQNQQQQSDNQQSEQQSEQQPSDKQQDQAQQSQNQSADQQSNEEQSGQQQDKQQQNRQEQSQKQGQQSSSPSSEGEQQQENSQPKTDSQKSEKPQESQQEGNPSQEKPADGKQPPENAESKQPDEEKGAPKQQGHPSQKTPRKQSQQNSTEHDDESGSTPEADDAQAANDKKSLRGELSTATPSEQDDASDEQSAALSVEREGEMTEQEAEKMLQSIRDRDMVRRLRRQAAERTQHIPVDRDW